MKYQALLLVVACVGARADSLPQRLDRALSPKCRGSFSDAAVTVPESRFTMGSDRFYPEEGPPVPTHVRSFAIDAHEVTNRQFAQFVAATGYRTQAERPDGGAFVFTPPTQPFVTPDPRLWWRYVRGATWRHPEGPASDIARRDNHPVVNVTYADASAYAAWAGRALPNEEQFEAAARIGVSNPDQAPDINQANTWQGSFPAADKGADGWRGATAPAGCFERSPIGTYDLIGNVWEWTRSPYLPTHGAIVVGDGSPGDPGFDPRQPNVSARVIKGGSFLCASNYCAHFRPAARHAQEETLAASHLGFRTTEQVRQLENN
jgi:formylglycine-generating enzyme required for sulfatase activity